MNRVALYARYSSDNQRDASIEDQLRLCRLYAEKQGWHVIKSYSDRAVSGASLIRPGIQALHADALRVNFDIVLAEALDRISRDQEDVAGLFKRLTFAGIKIVTLSEGEITHLHVGLKGTMNALFLKDLADKTRRGLRGRVEQGKAGGGLCYGYRVLAKLDARGEPVYGERAIEPTEAAAVQRIYQEFAAGKSPRAIAIDLNREGVPGPGGRPWSQGTIRGHACRGNGVINNELYIGRLVWNRQRFLKDPNTGKRVSRPNPAAEWIRTEVPELRIIDDVLWQSAKARQAELAILFEPTIKGVRAARAAKINQARRPAFLLSGLLTCGCCRGKYGIVVNDRYGCINHFRRGACDNGHTIRRDLIEARALVGLTDKLVSPEAVSEAVRAYHEQKNRLNHERRAQAGADRQALGKIERAIKGIMAAIEDGLYQPAMKARMDALEQQKAEIEARLREAPADIPDVNPNVAEVYRRNVIGLATALKDPDAGRRAAAMIRSLIGEVVMTPGAKRGEVKAILRGELLAILEIASGRAEAGRCPGQVITNAAASPRNQSKLNSIEARSARPGRDRFGFHGRLRVRAENATHAHWATTLSKRGSAGSFAAGAGSRRGLSFQKSRISGISSSRRGAKMIDWYRELGTSERRTFWACFAGWALDAFDVQIYSFVVPALIALWGITNAQAGLLATSALVISAFGGWVAGMLADRIGRAKLLMIMVAWFAFFTFLSGFTNSFEQLLIVRGFQGFGFGGEWAAGSVLIGEVIRAKHRGKAVGTVQSAWAWGWAAAAILATIIFQVLPQDIAWRAMFFAGILPALLIFYIRTRVPEPAIFKQATAAPATKRRGTLEIFGADLLWTTILGSILTTGAQGGYYAITTFLPTFLRTQRHLTVMGTGGYLAVIIIGSWLGYIVSAYLNDAIGRRKNFFIFAIGSLLIVVAYTQANISDSMMLVLGFPLGFFASGIFSGMGPVLTELFPTTVRGAGQGFCYNFGRGVGAFFPTLVGMLSVTVPLGTAIGIFAAIAYGIVIVAAVMLPETRGRELLAN